MFQDLATPVGFAHRSGHATPPSNPPVVQLIATVALALSTVIAITAVSLGIARADAPGGADSDGATLAVALLVGLLLSGMGGLTAVMAKRRRD